MTPYEGLCAYWSGSEFAYAVSCYESFGSIVGRAYIALLRDKVAPLGELPPAEEGYSRRGPQWLLLGTREYVNARYRAETGSEAYELLRIAQIAPARRTALPLSSMETRAGRDAAGRPETIALGFLATELLAERAGDEAILDYIRLLPSSTGWRAAFEGAFGVSVEDFHAAFEASRLERAPLLPHLADDLDEPVFVFVGDIAPDLQEELRASLEASRGLLATQFGVEASDFTVYAGFGPRGRSARVPRGPRTRERRALRRPGPQRHLPDRRAARTPRSSSRTSTCTSSSTSSRPEHPWGRPG